jgi:hypothetical protein
VPGDVNCVVPIQKGCQTARLASASDAQATRVSCSRTTVHRQPDETVVVRSRMQQVDFRNAVLDESSLANKALSYKRVGLWQ